MFANFPRPARNTQRADRVVHAVAAKVADRAVKGLRCTTELAVTIDGDGTTTTVIPALARTVVITRAITRLINRLYKLGAEVLYERVQAIHASGHAHGEELRLMLGQALEDLFGEPRTELLDGI